MMLLLLAILFFSPLLEGKVHYQQWNPGYINKEQTLAIKGICTGLILLSHMSGYFLDNVAWYDLWFQRIIQGIDQLMVAPFFFLSGFGIIKQYQLRGLTYANAFLKKRFLKTLLHFDIALIVFILVQSLFGLFFPPLINYITCWFGWGAVGNSNWFVFCILFLYLGCSLVFPCARRLSGRESEFFVSIALGGVTVFLWFFLKHHGVRAFWYDTLACFPAGVFYAVFKEPIDVMIRKRMDIVLLLLLSVFIGWHIRFGIDDYGIGAVLFCLVITSLSMRISFGGHLIEILGKNAFAIYILQRLPMNILDHFGLASNRFYFITLSLVLLIPIIIGIRKIWARFDSLVGYA